MGFAKKIISGTIFQITFFSIENNNNYPTPFSLQTGALLAVISKSSLVSSLQGGFSSSTGAVVENPLQLSICY